MLGPHSPKPPSRLDPSFIEGELEAFQDSVSMGHIGEAITRMEEVIDRIALPAYTSDYQFVLSEYLKHRNTMRDAVGSAADRRFQLCKIRALLLLLAQSLTDKDREIRPLFSSTCTCSFSSEHARLLQDFLAALSNSKSSALVQEMQSAPAREQRHPEEESNLRFLIATSDTYFQASNTLLPQLDPRERNDLLHLYLSQVGISTIVSIGVSWLTYVLLDSMPVALLSGLVGGPLFNRFRPR